MAKKKLLLNESTTRRFMKLATIKPSYVSNFITEAEEDEELMDAPMDEPAPEGEEDAALEAEPAMDDELEVEDEMDDPVGDEPAGDAEALVMDLLAKVQEFAKENGVAMELEGDEPEGEEDAEMDAEMDVEMDDAEPEGGEEPGEADMEMDMGAEEGGEEELALQEGRADEATNVSLINEEAIVAEVTKRVAKRLLKESAKQKIEIFE